MTDEQNNEQEVLQLAHFEIPNTLKRIADPEDPNHVTFIAEPIETGFGHTLAKGVKKAVAEEGLLGVFTGGLTASAGGITAAMVFAVLMALLFKPGDKR